MIAAIPLAILIWRIDPFRVRRAYAALGGTACLALIGVMSLKVPEQAWEPFQGINHVSSFVRSGFSSLSQLSTLGWMEADASLPEKLKTLPGGSCAPADKPPHIIMVLDESSFDVSTVPGMQVPPGYKDQFRSFDGKTRSFLVEGTGGPTWYTEYNVLSGLSARSFGRMQFYVTRIAANRVERGLPQTLAALRLQDLQPLSRAGLVPLRARVPALGRHRAHDRFQRNARGRCRARSFLLRPGRCA